MTTRVTSKEGAVPVTTTEQTDFGPVSYEPAQFNAEGKEVITRKDLGRFLRFLEAQHAEHPAEWIKVTVPTGPIFSKSDRGPTGRGKDEYSDYRGFKEAAGLMDPPLTASIKFRHNSPKEDGSQTTLLRIRLRPKEKLSASVQANRTAGLEKSRLTRATNKAKLAAEAAKANPGDEALQAAAKEAAKKLNETKARIAKNNKANGGGK